MAVLQDPSGVVVIVAVEYAFHYVRICAARDRLKQVAGRELAAVSQAHSRQPLSCSIDRLLPVNEDASCPGICCEDCREQPATGAAKVGDNRALRKVECSGEWRICLAARLGEHGMEDFNRL